MKTEQFKFLRILNRQTLQGVAAFAVIASLLTGCATKQNQPLVETKADYEKRMVAERTAADEAIRQAASKPPTAIAGDGWKSLFDGIAVVPLKLMVTFEAACAVTGSDNAMAAAAKIIFFIRYPLYS